MDKKNLDFSLPRNMQDLDLEIKEIIFKKRLIQTDLGNVAKVGDMTNGEYFDFILDRAIDLVVSLRMLSSSNIILRDPEDEINDNNDKIIVFNIFVRKKYNHGKDFINKYNGVSLKDEFSDILLLLSGDFTNGRKIGYDFRFFLAIDNGGTMFHEVGLFHCSFHEIQEKISPLDLKEIARHSTGGIA